VIVVDNASHDGSQQMLREKFPNVILVECSKNIGFGRANNLGAKRASGKYLFLLNSDTILRNNAVKILYNFIDTHLKVAVCGGNLFNEKNNPELSYRRCLLGIEWELTILSNNYLEKLLYGKNARFNYTGKPLKVNGFIAGADFMIRSEVFQQLNGFDSDFFMYHEDVELSYRVKKSNYLSYSVPQAEITHLVGKSSSDNLKWKAKIVLDGRKMSYQKTCNKVTIKICNSLYRITALIMSIRHKLKGNIEQYEKWKFMFNNI
jgi:GT2 family glycosyltransferase